MQLHILNLSSTYGRKLCGGRVNITGKKLAEQFGADSKIVEIAALLHDYAGIKDHSLHKDHHIHGAIEAEKILKEHRGLRELKNKRHKEEIENKLDDSKPLVDVVERIMRKSPSLATLFLKGFRIKKNLEKRRERA